MSGVTPLYLDKDVEDAALPATGEAVEPSLLRFKPRMARRLIQRFDGPILSQEWKEALWDKFVMGAPRSRCPAGECTHSPRGVHVVRAAIQRSAAWQGHA
jgi:hypothetical protein